MKIIGLNGSPHGKHGATVAHFNHLSQYFPEDTETVVHHIGLRMKALEKSKDKFREIIEEIKSADLIVWIFPVYIFHVPANVIRFVEVIKERKLAGIFQGKYGTAISTSVNFFDQVPQNYIRSVSEDLGMNFIVGHTPHFQDKEKLEERKRAGLWAQKIVNISQSKIKIPKFYAPLNFQLQNYQPGKIEEVSKTANLKILLITDAQEEDANLHAMIQTFTQLMPNSVEIVNLHHIKLVSGCTGCGYCQNHVGKCSLETKDDFDLQIRQKVKTADVILFAPRLKDRYFSARWKMMEDRRFVDNHRPTWCGKQIAYLISGPFSHLSDLKQLLFAKKHINRGEIVDPIVTDEYNTAAEITASIQTLIDQIFWAVEHNFVNHPDFIGIAGSKVFRDLIWEFQFVFPGDHNYYKTHGYYDFPKKSRLKFAFMNWLFRKEKRLQKFAKVFFKETPPEEPLARAQLKLKKILF